MMESKYNGFCLICKHKIFIGDEIEKDAELGKWVHIVHPNKIEAGAKLRKSKNTFVNAATLMNAVNSASSINALEKIITDEAVSAGSFNTDWTPSKYQQDIFDFISGGSGNGVVEAVAGSGKTSTIVKALEIVPKDATVAFLAFNKHIAKELKLRAPDHVRVSTIHALGLSLIRKLEEFDKRNGIDKDKVGGIMDDFWPIVKGEGVTDAMRIKNRMRRQIMRKVVSLAKATLADYEDGNAINEMVERYNLDVVEHLPDILEKLPEVMQKCLENVETIDYDDMIWLPLVHERLKNHFDKFEYLFIDEAQDLNNSQIQFILNSVYPHSRIVAVGDRKQSLYGFRGADTEAIPRLIKSLNASVLPLSISYRCPKSHVARAKEIVPQIEASETAIEGKVIDIDYKDFLSAIEPGDMVICRTNAPLIKPAFEAIKAGKKAMIRGQDIGAELVNFVERFQAMTLSELEINMSEFTEKEYNRLMDKGKELQAEMVKDKTETIRVVSDECKTVIELLQKLQMLFSDTNTGVVFSSVHRAKGLEAERVFILRPELMPHPKAKQGWEIIQEENCQYVAVTRSKNELYFVIGE